MVALLETDQSLKILIVLKIWELYTPVEMTYNLVYRNERIELIKPYNLVPRSETIKKTRRHFLKNLIDCIFLVGLSWVSHIHF